LGFFPGNYGISGTNNRRPSVVYYEIVVVDLKSAPKLSFYRNLSVHFIRAAGYRVSAIASVRIGPNSDGVVEHMVFRDGDAVSLHANSLLVLHHVILGDRVVVGVNGDSFFIAIQGARARMPTPS
jgi:hypothetical protein